MVNLKRFWLSSLPETYPIYSTLGTIIDFVGFHCVLPNLLIGNPKAIHSDISPCRPARATYVPTPARALPYHTRNQCC